MARDPSVAPAEPGAWLFRPWTLLVTGLLLSVGAYFVSASLDEPPLWLYLPLLGGGLVLAVAAVNRQFRRVNWDLVESRFETAALVSLAGFTCLAGYAALDREWDSGHMLLAALFLVSLVTSVLILLPGVQRRLAISLVVVFHFGGILTAVTSVDPPNSTGPWISKQLWTHVYRPYLQFMYLTNAYHFYSPDPGPPALMWFAIHYDDGTYVWWRMPERATSDITLQYQRRLALPEHTYQAMGRLPYTEAELQVLQARKVPVDQTEPWEDILKRRVLGSHFQAHRPLPIPWVLDVDVVRQYRAPTAMAKKLVASMAKRVLWSAPKPDDPKVKVTSVKVYRVVHDVIRPNELAEGVDPLEKTKHWVWFLGEYDLQGNLKDSTDPFLYWFLPIAYVPKDYPLNNQEGPPDTRGVRVPGIRVTDPAPKSRMLLDCLEIHAAGRTPARLKKEAPR